MEFFLWKPLKVLAIIATFVANHLYDPCSSYPCLPLHICTKKLFSRDCQIFCDDAMCENGGVCFASDKAACNCSNDYVGAKCEYSINDIYWKSQKHRWLRWLNGGRFSPIKTVQNKKNLNNVNMSIYYTNKISNYVHIYLRLRQVR